MISVGAKGFSSLSVQAPEYIIVAGQYGSPCGPFKDNNNGAVEADGGRLVERKLQKMQRK